MATLFTITKIMGVYGKGKNRAVLEVDETACLFGADLWDMVKGYGGLRGASPTAALIKAYIVESEFDEYWHDTLWRHRVKRSDDWELEMSGYGEDKYPERMALELMISLEHNMENKCCNQWEVDRLQRRLEVSSYEKVKKCACGRPIDDGDFDMCEWCDDEQLAQDYHDGKINEDEDDEDE